MEVSLSEEEESAAEVEEPVVSKTNWAAEEPNDETTMKLLRRRGQLELRRRDYEKRRVRMQVISLSQIQHLTVAIKNICMYIIWQHIFFCGLKTND